MVASLSLNLVEKNSVFTLNNHNCSILIFFLSLSTKLDSSWILTCCMGGRRCSTVP